MKKIKEFYKKHEREIKLVGIGVGCVIGYKGIKSIKTDFTNRKKDIVDMTGKLYLSWPAGTAGVTDLETAKKILDINSGIDESFGIIKRGTDYMCVYISGEGVWPE